LPRHTGQYATGGNPLRTKLSGKRTLSGWKLDGKRAILNTLSFCELKQRYSRRVKCTEISSFLLC
jgi:hypothetical protein